MGDVGFVLIISILSLFMLLVSLSIHFQILFIYDFFYLSNF